MMINIINIFVVCCLFQIVFMFDLNLLVIYFLDSKGDCQDFYFSDVLLCLEGVLKIYGVGLMEVRVLVDVSLAIEWGSYCVIMGVFGLGKFIMMNIIGCLDCFILGYYFFDGEDVFGLSVDQLVKICNCKIGFVFQ